MQTAGGMEQTLLEAKTSTDTRLALAWMDYEGFKDINHFLMSLCPTPLLNLA